MRKGYRDYPALRDGSGVSFANQGEDFGFVGALPYVSEGEGHTTGLEFLAQGGFGDRGFVLASYTRARSEFTDREGALSASLWDTPHAVTLAANLGIGPSWDLSIKGRLTSGRPYVPFDMERSEAVFERTGRGVWDYARLGERRQPHYRRLDIRIAREFSRDGLHIKVFGEIQNIEGRYNILSRRLVRDGRGQLYELGIGGLPRLPALGLVVKF